MLCAEKVLMMPNYLYIVSKIKWGKLLFSDYFSIK